VDLSIVWCVARVSPVIDGMNANAVSVQAYRRSGSSRRTQQIAVRFPPSFIQHRNLVTRSKRIFSAPNNLSSFFTPASP